MKTIKNLVGMGLVQATMFYGCATRMSVPQVESADQAALSLSAQEAKKYAPQAFAEAEQLRVKAHALANQGENAAAAVKAEEATLAYQSAFITLRAARAQVRVEDAGAQALVLEEELIQLDLTQASLRQEADIFELQARVYLDTEQVEDLGRLSPERAVARRQAAVFLGSEAEVLCFAAALLRKDDLRATSAGKKAARLQVELNHGSIKDDLYPRAAQLRSACLKELTLARRPLAQAAPESAGADRLLKDLSEADYLPYRDDRGVVVQLTTAAKSELWEQLGRVAKAHSNFPVLVLVHGKTGQQKLSLEEQGQRAAETLKASGAPQVDVRVIGSHQPIIDRRVAGADKKNARLEVIFIHPGR